MNVVVGCSFTISKKLESLIEAGNPLYIQINSVNGNKGIGHMSMTTKKMPRPEEIGNTSIMLDVISVDESTPDFQDSTPVSNFFSGGQDIEREGVGSPIAKFAKVNPDSEVKSYANRHEGKPIRVPQEAEGQLSKAQGVRKPIRQTPRQETMDELSPSPSQMPSLADKKQGSIMSYEELIAEVESLGNIDVEIPTPMGNNGRLGRAAAVQIEKQGKIAPRIKRPAFVRNVRGGHLEIADMEEKVANGEIFDLGRVPARKIRDSRDLKWCLDNGLLAFCDREEYLYWLENKDADNASHDHGLRAGSIDEVSDSMFDDLPDPMVGDYATEKRGSRDRPRRPSGQSRPARQAVNRDNSDIIDTEEQDDGGDQEDYQRQKLIESMDPSGMPRESHRTIPSGHSSPRSMPPPQAGGGAKIKSIRKV